MPHIRLTISQNVRSQAAFDRLLPELVSLLCSFESISPASVKAYGDVREFWSMGEGAPAGFIHCEVSLLSGRAADLRGKIASAFHDCLSDHFRLLVDAHDAGVTVEIREMDAAAYRKTAAP